MSQRQARTGDRPHHRFALDRNEASIVWHFRENRHALAVPPGIDLLGENLLLKMLLNIHSTLVAGRLGRYADNLMTHVSASNFKLIDRSTRYARTLLKRHHGLDVDYETVARQVLAERRRLQPGEAIVLKTVEALSAT